MPLILSKDGELRSPMYKGDIETVASLLESALAYVKEKYEAHHGLRISDEAIVAAVNLSARYITDRFLPDKAVDVIDEAGAEQRLLKLNGGRFLMKVRRRARSGLRKSRKSSRRFRHRTMNSELIGRRKKLFSRNFRIFGGALKNFVVRRRRQNEQGILNGLRRFFMVSFPRRRRSLKHLKKRIKEEEEIINGVHVHRCKHIARIANFATIWPSVFFEIMKEDFDIVHSHVFGHVHFVLSALSAKLSGAKHVHTTHCPWTDAFRSLAGRIGILISYDIFSRFALRLTDKVIAITPWEFDFIKRYGGKEKQIVNLPNGMAEEFFDKIKKNYFRKKYGIRKDEKIVLFFGRLNITKGPEKFVEIAKIVLAKRKDVTFLIRGPDEGMKETVKKLIGKEKRILLLPETRNKDEIIKMYRSSDLFVIPSYSEGLPLTMFEAMASGLPIVASPVNGIPYEIKEPENGFLVPYGDNDKFADRILQILDNPSLRSKISKNNLKKSKDYSWDIISKRTLDLYREITNINQIQKIDKILNQIPSFYRL